MFAVKYKNIRKFKVEYLNDALSENELKSMRMRWELLQNQYNILKVFHFSIEQILLGHPRMLVEVYYNFVNAYNQWSITHTENEQKQLLKKISDIFNYTSKQKKIAELYSVSNNGPLLNTCYYCNMAYINKYTYKGTNKIHFDLDHYLDKGKCPIIGLSLMNFVPSCQCCNEKIKRSQLIGQSKEQCLEAMPTRPGYNFENDVEIQIRAKGTNLTKGTYLQNKDAYQIKFATGNHAYADEVNKMRYTERYQFHIAEALLLMDKKIQYPDSELAKMSGILGITVEQIREDIFGAEFAESEYRCFSKLRKDILK